MLCPYRTPHSSSVALYASSVDRYGRLTHFIGGIRYVSTGHGVQCAKGNTLCEYRTLRRVRI
eukprot:2535357-Rhodomonas_salina.1